MNGRRESILASKSLDQVADFMAEVTPESPNDQLARAGFLLRQTVMQREATDTSVETAQFTRKNAKYMLASVIVLAISSVTTLIVSLVK